MMQNFECYFIFHKSFGNNGITALLTVRVDAYALGGEHLYQTFSAPPTVKHYAI